MNKEANKYLPQLAKFDISAVVHDLNTTNATDSTGPQVFQTVHWNIAWRENISKIYHLLEYTSMVISFEFDILTWIEIYLEKTASILQQL